MAGSTISTLNVKLVASIGSFSASMAKAAKPLTSFAGNVAATSLKVGGLVSAITGLVGAGSLAALTHQSMEAIDTQAKLADRFGMTTEGLTGLQHAAGLAGVSNEQLTGGFEKMFKSIADAAEGTGTAKDALDTLGLSAAKLANESPDQAFKDIADGLIAIKNPAQRAQVAMDIFGKSGQALLPLLMSGAEGIKAAQEEARRLGLTFSRLDAAKVEAANDAWTRMTAVVTGVGNQLAIAVAPYLEAAAVKATEFATAGGGIGPKVGGAVEWVAKAVAYLGDSLSVLQAGWNGLRGVAAYALGSVLDALGMVIGGVEWLYEKVSGTNAHFGDAMQDLAKGLLSVGDDAFRQAGENWNDFVHMTKSRAVTDAFADIQSASQAAAERVAQNAAQMGGALKQAGEDAKAVQKITAALDGLRKQVETFGMTEGQKKLFDLSAMGATPDQLAQAKALSDQLDSMNAAKKKADEMQQAAKSVFDATRTPMEKYEEQIGKLGDMLNAGVLDWDTYGRAVRQAKSELEKSADAGVNSPKAPDLLQAGSAQALRFVYDATRGTQRMTRDDVSKQQLAEAQGATRILSRIERNTASSTAATEEMDV